MATLRPQRLGHVALFAGLTLERRGAGRSSPARGLLAASRKGGRVDGSGEVEKRDLKAPGDRARRRGTRLRGSIAGNWIWQAGSRPHTAPQQSDGSATALPT